MVDRSLVSRQEAKIRELETRLEFERTQVKRLEVGAHVPVQSSAGRAERPQRLEPRVLSRARQARSRSCSTEASAKLPRQLTGRVPSPPLARPALCAPRSLPALHSDSVLAFCQGTRAA